ncbi:uncharacterized protein LOC111618615 [Centruroides sculpturatus]|uniref:uncharacterized protein LOC111618615 n=1 Tax=Centruroides sculpturatus TaxID=218467 RepID=UPI000C6D3E53|nr:uncharacterized protein LOC111618615 [Centruroides sculpturatus]
MKRIFFVLYVVLGSSFIECKFKVQSGTFLKTYSAYSNGNNKGILKSFNFFQCLLRCLRKEESCRAWQLMKDNEECRLQIDQEIIENGIILERYERLITCNNPRCLNGGVCKNITPNTSSSAYRCECRCGSCGKNCENLNFIRKAQTAIAGKNLQEKTNTSSEDCIRLCLNNSNCKSVDYNRKDMTCYLNKATHENESTEVFSDFDYYYPNCTCPLD